MPNSTSYFSTSFLVHYEQFENFDFLFSSKISFEKKKPLWPLIINIFPTKRLNRGRFFHFRGEERTVPSLNTVQTLVISDSSSPSTGSWALAIHPICRGGRRHFHSAPFVRRISSRTCSCSTKASRSTGSRTSSPTRSSPPSG